MIVVSVLQRQFLRLWGLRLTSLGVYPYFFGGLPLHIGGFETLPTPSGRARLILPLLLRRLSRNVWR